MPTAEIPTSSSEQKPNKVEIFHFPVSDILVNTHASLANYAAQLVELFKDGASVPEGWKRIHSDFAVGNVDGVKFFVKPKHDEGRGYDYEKEYAREVVEGSYLPFQNNPIRFAQLRNSVLNEMSRAPLISELVSASEAQELIRSYGFESIRFVEPIVGVIDKQTRKKRLVYEYINAPITLRELGWEKGEPAKSAYKDLTQDLHKYLADSGISTVELHDNHILADVAHNLYLIDTELYHSNGSHNETGANLK